MLNITETFVGRQYSVNDCRGLNRLEMIGFISIDIMSFQQTLELRDYFKQLFKGITRGPWTIVCHPSDNSVSYKCDNIYVNFYPKGTEGIIINYYDDDNSIICYSEWSIDEIEDVLL